MNQNGSTVSASGQSGVATLLSKEQVSSAQLEPTQPVSSVQDGDAQMHLETSNRAHDSDLVQTAGGSRKTCT